MANTYAKIISVRILYVKNGLHAQKYLLLFHKLNVGMDSVLMILLNVQISIWDALFIFLINALILAIVLKILFFVKKKSQLFRPFKANAQLNIIYLLHVPLMAIALYLIHNVTTIRHLVLTFTPILCSTTQINASFHSALHNTLSNVKLEAYVLHPNKIVHLLFLHN